MRDCFHTLPAPESIRLTRCNGLEARYFDLRTHIQSNSYVTVFLANKVRHFDLLPGYGISRTGRFEQRSL